MDESPYAPIRSQLLGVLQPEGPEPGGRKRAHIY